MQEYRRIDITRDQIVPIAERMRKSGRYLVMIHAFIDKDGQMDISYDYAVDPAIEPHSFRDARMTLTPEQVQIETARCLGCGASWVDPNKCIGCGVCTTKCVFDAIHLKRDHPECSTMMKAEDKLKGIASMAGKRLGESLRGGKG